MKFTDLKFNHNIQAKHYFKNGYGISVIQNFEVRRNNVHFTSQTNNHNEFEIAVLKDGYLYYDTEITDDVIGHLTAKEVEEYMKQIEALK